MNRVTTQETVVTTRQPSIFGRMIGKKEQQVLQTYELSAWVEGDAALSLILEDGNYVCRVLMQGEGRVRDFQARKVEEKVL